MNNQKSLEIFNTMSVPQAVIRNAVPAMIAMLMVLVYNLCTDQLPDVRICGVIKHRSNL